MDDSPEARIRYAEMRLAGIPQYLNDKTVLDVGGYKGDFAHVCLQRGAIKATVVDSHQYGCYPWKDPEPIVGIEYVEKDILDYDVPADFVICYNVIYHVKSPWDVLEHLRKLTRWKLALSTRSFASDLAVWRPWKRDEPNWRDACYWEPSAKGLVQLLNSVGFDTIEEVGRAGDHITFRCS